MSDALRIAIVGCGAVAERFHLPPLLARDDCRVTALVDRNPARTEALQRLAPEAARVETASEAVGLFDAAIVAVPHAVHALVAEELLRAGKAVLVEKPLALDGRQCDSLLAAARAGGAPLTVGQMRRFCPAVAVARRWIEVGLIGPIAKVDVRDGAIFGWPVESDFQFRKELAGGGVLMDTGAHTLDMLIDWFGDLRPLVHRDDACGGVEADCWLELETSAGTPCIVELSRTRNLRNSAILEGARGRLEVLIYENRLRWMMPELAGGCEFVCEPVAATLPHPSPWRHMFDLQLDDWVRACRAGRPGRVSGEEGAKVVRLIEQSYAMRQPLNHPWESFTSVGKL